MQEERQTAALLAHVTMSQVMHKTISGLPACGGAGSGRAWYMLRVVPGGSAFLVRDESPTAMSAPPMVMTFE